jgi:hypothetical protein
LSGVGRVPRRVDDYKCRPGSAAGASVQPNRLQKQGPGLRQVTSREPHLARQSGVAWGGLDEVCRSVAEFEAKPAAPASIGTSGRQVTSVNAELSCFRGKRPPYPTHTQPCGRGSIFRTSFLRKPVSRPRVAMHRLAAVSCAKAWISQESAHASLKFRGFWG